MSEARAGENRSREIRTGGTDACGLRIGEVRIPVPVVLAPMAGVTDQVFRILCREMGAGLVATEMVSAKAITYHNKNTESLMVTCEEERPVSLQLFGSEPDVMAEAAAMIESRPFDVLDINMGCPVPKIVNNGEGSALLPQPELAWEIVRRVAGAVKKPVTVKMRIGFENRPVDIVRFAQGLEEAGAAAIAVHGRSRQQYYSGKADWDAIRRVKESVKIPVIGNGDVDSGEAAVRMMEETGCDAVMIGRAARGNPWIFREVREALNRKGGYGTRPSAEEVRSMILRHARMLSELKGERTAMREMRKHIAWYTAGMPHSAALRRAANTVETLADIEKIIDNGRL